MNLDPQKLASEVVAVIKKAVAPLKAELAETKAELAETKQELAALKADHVSLSEKALKGGAAWQRGVMYAVNDCVQHAGGLWKCVETHVSGATFSHEHFLLQVKSGRDGRDAR